MSVNNMDLGRTVRDYGRSYEDQLGREEEHGHLGGAEHGESVGLLGNPVSGGRPGQIPSGRPRDDGRVGGRSGGPGRGALQDDKGGSKVVGQGGRGGSSRVGGKDDGSKADQIKADAAKSSQKASEIQKTLSTDSITKTEAAKGTAASNGLGKVCMESVTMTKEEAEKAYEVGQKLTEALTELVEKSGGNFASLSAEDLLAAFMKIQLTDPAKNTETLNDLNDVMKSLRQLAHKGEEASIAKQEVEQEKAIKAAEEAKGYSSAMKVFKVVLIVVAIVAAVVATALSFGSAAPIAAIVVIAIVGALAGITNAGISMKEAQLNYKAAELNAKANEASLDALDFERVKEMFQEMVGDSQEMIQAMMEAFNNFCSLLKTLIDRQGASVKALSDATIR